MVHYAYISDTVHRVSVMSPTINPLMPTFAIWVQL